MQSDQPSTAGEAIHSEASPQTARGTSSCLHILHITDCHLSQGADGELLGVNTRDSLDAVLARIAEDGQQPDLVLATGDLAQDASVEAYTHFKQKMAAFGCPVSWFPGNHDARASMQAVVGDGDELRKVVRLGDWQFILLDSLVEGKVHGWLADAELKLLEDALSATPNVHTLVSLHHHPIDIDCRWLDKIGLHNRDVFLDILDQHDQVKGVLWGHIHQQLDTQRRGVPYYATPSTCIQFLPRSDDFAIDEVAPGYRWLRLYPDGRIETEVKRADAFEFNVDMNSTGY